MAEKKIKGRKRHVTVDTQGLLLHASVHAANIHDTIAGRDIVYQTFKEYSSVRAFCADSGYRGTTKNFVEQELKLRMDIFNHEEQVQKGFCVIKKRWIVERFFAWIGNFRRLAKDYEKVIVVSQQFIVISAIAMILKKF